MGPFTVDELVLRKGVTIMDACYLVWDVSDEAFADYLRSRRSTCQEQVERVEREHDAERGPFVPPMEIVHHVYGESRG